MGKQTISPRPGGPPVAVRAGSLIFFSGIDPKSPEAPGGIHAMGEIGKQTEFVIEKLIRALGSMGLTLDDVVKVNAYIDDARKWPEFNAAYNRHFTRDETRPARATIPAGRFDEGMCVELDVVALAPEGR